MNPTTEHQKYPARKSSTNIQHAYPARISNDHQVYCHRCCYCLKYCTAERTQTRDKFWGFSIFLPCWQTAKSCFAICIHSCHNFLFCCTAFHMYIGGWLSQRTKTRARVDNIVPKLQRKRNFVDLSDTMHVFLWDFFLGHKICTQRDLVPELSVIARGQTLKTCST